MEDLTLKDLTLKDLIGSYDSDIDTNVNLQDTERSLVLQGDRSSEILGPLRRWTQRDRRPTLPRMKG